MHFCYNVLIMKKIGIVGGGSIGLTYAALLSEVLEVHLVVRRHEQAIVIEEQGVSFLGSDNKERFVGRVNASTDFSILDGSELIIIAVKSYDTLNIIDNLNKVTGKNTKILTVQNGIEAFQVLKSGISRPEHVFSGVTYAWASKKDDRSVVNGRSLTAVVDAGIGDITRVIKLARMLNLIVSDDAKRVVWDKLALSIAQNGLSAIKNKHFGELLASQECVSEAKKLLEEFVAVAKAEGLTYDIEDLLQKLKNNWTDSVFYPSTWQDIHAGHKTEIDALNGAISKLGKEHNIQTPNNDKMIEAVKKLEVSKFGNIDSV
ncbi:MAG: 2-dehydropantoate 2-reductase [Acidimicrobiia bacterium]